MPIPPGSSPIKTTYPIDLSTLDLAKKCPRTSNRRRSNRPATEQKTNETRWKRETSWRSQTIRFFRLGVLFSSTSYRLISISDSRSYFRSLIMLVCAFVDRDKAIEKQGFVDGVNRPDSIRSLDSVERNYLHVYSRTERTRVGENRWYRRTIRPERPSSVWIHRERVSIQK